MATEEVTIPDGVESTDDLSEETLNEMSSEQLVALVQKLQQKGDTGPEPVTNTTAHQLAFARCLRDLMTDDGGEVEGFVLYSPDGEVPEGFDEDEILSVFTNGTIQSGRREAWFTEVFEQLVDDGADSNGPRYRALLRENLQSYIDLVQEVSRGSIKDVLDEKGYPVPEIEDNPNVHEGAQAEAESEDMESEDEEDEE